MFMGPASPTGTRYVPVATVKPPSRDRQHVQVRNPDVAVRSQLDISRPVLPTWDRGSILSRLGAYRRHKDACTHEHSHSIVTRTGTAVLVCKCSSIRAHWEECWAEYTSRVARAVGPETVAKPITVCLLHYQAARHLHRMQLHNAPEACRISQAEVRNCRGSS